MRKICRNSQSTVAWVGSGSPRGWLSDDGEIGRDCVGALQFLHEGELPDDINKLSGYPVDADQIESLLGELHHAPLGLDKERDFRISVTGAQEKTALLRHGGGWIKPSGTTPTSHIIKPPIGRLPNGMDLSNSVENESLCLKLMEGFGLRAAHAEIVTFGAQGVSGRALR